MDLDSAQFNEPTKLGLINIKCKFYTSRVTITNFEHIYSIHVTCQFKESFYNQLTARRAITQCNQLSSLKNYADILNFSEILDKEASGGNIDSEHISLDIRLDGKPQYIILQ